ncbi:ChbG/HpnK family deacetylase [Algoriphagus sp.]|uniref:carbohydrate deacetylase n=1 Tax=Algoriphagus sp. TaxID=1872435 RepID=UPI0025FA81B3|nr:ChbG/HpnK family deacetylase [Algoriphagus sp.]
MTSKILIINADDFGYDRDATAGILELLADKKISSTTVMANLVKENEVISLKKFTGIGTGLHLNLIEGSPISEPRDIPSLVGKEGKFLGAKGLLKNAILNKISEEEIYQEVKAQLKKLTDFGLNLSHVDSHQHAHQFPIIGPIILRALAKLKIKKVRNSIPLGASVAFRSVLLQLFTKLSPVEKNQFLTTDGLISNFSFGQKITLDGFEKAIQSSFAQANSLEFMTHPALENKLDSYLKRKEEFLFWKKEPVQEVLKSKGIRLIHFGEL